MGGKSRVEYGNLSLSWITVLAVIIIGIMSLFSLYLGFQAYGSNNADLANTYIIIGTAGFAVMGYMFFRTRAVPSPNKLNASKVDVVTTLECPKCGTKKVRDFETGDYVFRDDVPCTNCDGRMVITRINRRKKPEKEKEKVEV